MVHVCIALDGHELVDPDRARLAKTAEVVSLEIDQHHMFGLFLGAASQLGDRGRVAARQPRARARDRPGIDMPALYAHQPFRRTRKDRETGERGNPGECTRIRRTEAAIESGGGQPVRHARSPATREIGLVHVPRRDVRERAPTGLEIGGRVVFGDATDCRRIGMLWLRSRAREIRREHSGGSFSPWFGRNDSLAGPVIVHERCAHAPGTCDDIECRQWQREGRLHLASQLVAQVQEPAARKWPRRRRRRPLLRAPPLIEAFAETRPGARARQLPGRDRE